MADITKCTNSHCPMQKKCYRKTAKDNDIPPEQFSYATGEYNGTPIRWCDHFVPNTYDPYIGGLTLGNSLMQDPSKRESYN